MIDLTPFTTDAYLVATIQSKQDTLKIFENADYRWLTLGDELTLQGVMEKSQPQQVSNPVNQAMLLFLLCSEPSSQILNLGLGSGCFERAVTNKAGFELTTVEINPNVIKAAKQYFFLNDNNHIVAQCAEQFIAQSSRKFDVILIDVFSGKSQPAFLQKQAFLCDCHARLSTYGKICINFTAKNKQQLIALLTTLRSLFSHIVVIEFNQYKNIVLIASEQRLDAINIEQIKLHNDFSSPDLAAEIKQLFYIPKLD
ncbi:spermidine synthase [Pseudoalteromonas rhizosphaerae]|uniref:spermidine synthase n=1 Tax=Pseudoalteromonas rhizosphaerae TaxID=2518973 RepID=UPI00123093A6|nr:fused MFS/spermidine synthase [Pseudoalteromonas rhizosphaerae]